MALELRQGAEMERANKNRLTVERRQGGCGFSGGAGAPHVLGVKMTGSGAGGCVHCVDYANVRACRAAMRAAV
ncbi:hypothetical protein [Corticibacter populi]|uniref:hypothetical protein n=1 Tax=Corticibacter populi TaxID=1550736 RepID=UPI00102AB281|nr:hypothetical protein [Corticibacter populi]